MTAIRWVLAALFFAALSAYSQSVEADPEKTMGAVAMITGRLGTSGTFGAGIIVNRSRKRLQIVTAGHVVRRGAQTATEVTVYLHSEPKKPLHAKLEAQFDPELDIAMLTVDNLASQGVDGCAVPMDRLPKPGVLKRGAEVYPLGNPNGEKWMMPVRPDVVVRVAESEIKFQSAGIAVGFSGGALLNRNMQVVGLIRADEPPYGSAIEIARVLDLLKSWKYEVHLLPEAPNAATPLHIAVRDDDFHTVQRLLEQECTDVEAPDNPAYAYTALDYAAANGRTDMIRLLLKAGANPNAAVRNGETALEFAAGSGDRGGVEELLAHGAIASTNALTYAAGKGSLEIVKLLLAAGAKPNAAEPVLASVKYDAILGALIAAGAAVNWKDSQGNTTLQLAVREHNLESVKLLLRAGADINVLDQGGASLVQQAIPSHDLAMFLLKASPKLPPDADRLLRHAAYTKGWTDMLTELVSRGVGKVVSMDAALKGATEAGDVASVRALLVGGANPEPKEETDRGRPINIAARGKAESRLELLKVLVSHGAEVTRQGDSLDDSPLHIVMFELKPPDFQAAEFLLSHTKDFTARGAAGTLLHQSSRDGCTECVRLLIKAGAPLEAPFHESYPAKPLHMALEHPEIVRLLLAAGARVDAENGRPGSPGESPLFHLAGYRHFDASLLESARLLIEAHAKVNFSYYGTTPLHMAAEAGNKPLVTLLLASGANRFAKDGKGKTPAALAKDPSMRALLSAP